MHCRERRFWIEKLTRKVSALVGVIIVLAMAGNPTSVAEEMKLVVRAPRVTGFGSIGVPVSSKTSIHEAFIADLNQRRADQTNLFDLLYGSGRPGTEGGIVVEGIGLNGTTAVVFEGTGVTAVEVATDPEALNSPVYMQVRIEPWAEPGPRHFTLMTPRGPVFSGDVVFTVSEPRVIGFRYEGSPGTSGYINVYGVGFDGTQEIRFDGEGVTVRDFMLYGEINPIICMHVDISPTAPLGPRRFSVVTSHGVIDSGQVMFTVTNPRIMYILEGNNTTLDGIREAEGAPGTRGQVFIYGVGLRGASAIEFSGQGLTGRIYPSRGELLNTYIIAEVTIAPDAPPGPRTFTLIVPRAPGFVSSTETGVTLTVTPPRIDRPLRSIGAPGTRGRFYIRGVGLGRATEIQFDGDGIVGTVIPRGRMRFLHSMSEPR